MGEGEGEGKGRITERRGREGKERERKGKAHTPGFGFCINIPADGANETGFADTRSANHRHVQRNLLPLIIIIIISRFV